MAGPNDRARLGGCHDDDQPPQGTTPTLTVTATGFQVQRDRYALVARWQDVTGVDRRRHQLLLPVEELRLSDSELLERSSTGNPCDCPPRCPDTRRPDASSSASATRTGAGDQSATNFTTRPSTSLEDREAAGKSLNVRNCRSHPTTFRCDHPDGLQGAVLGTRRWLADEYAVVAGRTVRVGKMLSCSTATPT